MYYIYRKINGVIEYYDGKGWVDDKLDARAYNIKNVASVAATLNAKYRRIR